MNYSILNKCDVANGEGVRVSLFVSGCPHKCKGCFNPETWDYDFGKRFNNNVMDTILWTLEEPYIQGLTLLGGEPLAPLNKDAIVYIAKECKKYLPNKDIWCYTGYTYEEIKDHEALQYIDVLVDGRYIEEERDVSLQFRGSSNQRIIDVPETRKSGTIKLWVSSDGWRS